MSTASPLRNVHGTAIVAGTTGLIFVGPSGIGKSSMAFACLSQARRLGLYAALIGDDQVFISVAGGHVIAHRPPTIAGLMEFRGTGIGTVESLPYAILHNVIDVVDPLECERLPAENAHFFVNEEVSLPLVRMARTTTEPLSLLATFIPQLARQTPYAGL